MERYRWCYNCSEALDWPDSYAEETENYMSKIVDYSNNQEIIDTLYISGFKRGYNDVLPGFSNKCNFLERLIETEFIFYDSNSPDFGKFRLGEILFHFFKEAKKGFTYYFGGYLDNGIFHIVHTEVNAGICTNSTSLTKDEIINHFNSLINCGLISLEEYKEI